MTPQPQATPTGVGNDHAWAQGRRRQAGVTSKVVGAHRDPDTTVYSTEKPPPEPERKLLAVGGEGGRPERRLNGLRVWSDKYQETLPVDVEVLTRFARELAEAKHAEEAGYDARASGMGRDPQYLLDGPQTSAANIVCALNRAWAGLMAEKKGVDESPSGL